MRFLSCFSGIEAASVAFAPLGWRCVGVAEVDRAASRLLARHYAAVPNLGDVTAPDFTARAAALRPDILVGGPPCQDFSVAGLRAGLAGDRGNLTLRWVEIIRAIRPSLALTENVPGWLSVNRGHAFGAFLAALVGCDSALVPPRQCGGRWSDAGMVDGPEGRCAWRTLDAQFFGLAQRRRRVFVVFCPGDGADPAEILFERQGVRGNPPPRREAREGFAPDAQGGAGIGGGYARRGAQDDDDAAATGIRVPGVRGGERRDLVADVRVVRHGTGIGFGGGRTSGPIEQAACLTSHGQRLDFEVETFVAHALRGKGFDASEDGTGRGTPLVPVQMPPDIAGTLKACAGKSGLPNGAEEADRLVPVAFRTSPNCGAWETGDRTDALTTATDPAAHVLCFSSKDHGADASVGVAPTMRAMGHADSHANAGGQLDVAYDLRGREGGAQFEGPHDTANIRAASGGSSRSYVADRWAVRRLTPDECEALQGFPRGYTAGQADGPRYKQLGNSWAVNVARWIGERIDAALRRQREEAA